jgi:hypothetical protein
MMFFKLNIISDTAEKHNGQPLLRYLKVKGSSLGAATCAQREKWREKVKFYWIKLKKREIFSQFCFNLNGGWEIGEKSGRLLNKTF